MDSLIATYKDEEEEEEEEDNEQQDPNKSVNTPLNESTSTPQELNTTNSDAPSSSSSLSSSEEQEQEQEQLSEPQSEEQTHPTKKHKPVSSLTPQPQPPLIPKKPNKKKPNNVWFSKSNRKGKKKTKPKPKSKPTPNNGHHPSSSFAETPIQIIPIPRIPEKIDDTPDVKICLSKIQKAEKVELSDDRMSAGSAKGYRMVRATRGVVKGAWYYEIKVEKLGDTGHVRLGWSTGKGDLQAPVGYDGNSFGYRDIDGCKIHKALREGYGEEGFVEGDVIGFYINLPDGDLYVPKRSNWVWYKGHKYACPANGKEDSDKIVPGSEISFFKNGICQGVAFKDVNGGCYYPAASMYTLPNQPNCVVKFNFGPDFDFFPENFGDRPLPTPMIEVPYQVSDSVTENGTPSVEKLQQSS